MCTRNHFGRVFRWIFLFCCFFHVCKPICCCFYFFLLVLSIHLHFLPLDVFLRARPILSNILSSNIKWTIKICINSMPDDFVSKVFWLFESPMHSAHTQHTPWEKNKFRPVERKREKEVCVKLNWVTPHAHFFSLSFSMLHFALFTCNEENALVTYWIPQFSTFLNHFMIFISLNWFLFLFRWMHTHLNWTSMYAQLNDNIEIAREKLEIEIVWNRFFFTCSSSSSSSTSSSRLWLFHRITASWH